MQPRCLLRYNGGMEKNKRKNDILLILVALLLAGVLWGVLTLTKRQGGEAIVTVDGKTVAVLPLSEDTVYVWTAPKPEGNTNTVEVANGRVCVKEANCPDGICERSGWIEYAGESIVCLPHKLIVTVVGGEALTDAMAQ